MRCDCEAMGLVSNPLNEVKPLRSARKQDRIRFERTEKFFLPLRQSDDGNPPEEVELTENLDRASELSLTAVHDNQVEKEHKRLVDPPADAVLNRGVLS